jgi:carbamoyltransferase
MGGLFFGGAELGPRALGQRSIVCDPRRPAAKDILNRRVKYREPFRPFAPAVLLEAAPAWLDLQGVDPASPFMLRVCRFLPEVRDRVPGVVHVDGTGRLQTLTRDANGRFYDLVARFSARVGVPMLLNTSFNVAGEPIVETPEDAIFCLLATGLDFCVLEDRLIVKADGYRSLLDLVPRMISSPVSLALAPPEGGRPAFGERTARFSIDTPWGQAERQVDTSLLGIIEQIDGEADGWTILDRLVRAGKTIDVSSLCRSMATLRGARVVALQASGPKWSAPP